MKRYWAAIRQFVQFNIVGIANTAVDFIIFTLLTELAGLVYIAAKILSYTCGVLNSYFLNSNWTFKKERKRTSKEFVLFLMVNLFSLGASLGMMALCRNWLGIQSDFICNILATPVSVLINFFGVKLFVFQKK